MKKIIVILFLSFFFNSPVLANSLGEGLKKIDLNFKCKLALPEKQLKDISKEKRYLYFGFREYKLENQNVLLQLNFDQKDNIYNLPLTVVQKFKGEKKYKTKNMYLWFDYYGSPVIFQRVLYYYEDKTFALVQHNYRIPENDNLKFKKKLLSAIKIKSDDKYVKAISDLTLEIDKYTDKNKKMISLKAPYKCDLI